MSKWNCTKRGSRPKNYSLPLRSEAIVFWAGHPSETAFRASFPTTGHHWMGTSTISALALENAEGASGRGWISLTTATHVKEDCAFALLPQLNELRVGWQACYLKPAARWWIGTAQYCFR